MPTDQLPLRRIDHIRFFVGNAKQSAYFYRNAFGFDVIAYEGLETGVKHEAGYVLRQGQITFVLTSSLRANDPDNMRLMFHGDGVKDIAFDCDGDTLLIQVEQIGAACHEGYRSCFFRAATPAGGVSRVGEPLTDPY